jgi:GTP cyclohydrolase I
MKYAHQVSYIAKGNISGCSQILNNIKNYKTKSQLENLTEFIKENNNFESVSVTNILTVKNE